MSAPLEDECRAAVRQSLQRRFESLVAELARILAAELPPGTRRLHFEYDSPHFGDDFPVVFYPLDQHGELSVAPRRLLPDSPPAVPDAVLEDPRYEAAGLDTWELASAEFVPWFADCW